MEQLLCHLVGDYLLQNDWMASNKVKSIWVAIVHGLFYTLPFLFLTQDPDVLGVICASHILIDHWRVATRVNQLKNWNFNSNGFPEDRPIWLTTWVIILMDNTLHLLINYGAINYL